MLRRLPVVATLIVLIAVVVMVQLGLWQLDRKAEKEALVLRYAAAEKLPERALDAWQGERVPDDLLYRRVWIDCAEVGSITARAGHDAGGETGWVRIAPCRLQQGGRIDVVLGWAVAPGTVSWNGGLVHGMINGSGALVADPPLAGLAANARPDPASLPNNHLSYALQWFAFAASALAIYALALRKRLAAGGEGG